MRIAKPNLLPLAAVNPVNQVCSEFPLVLNTGRIRDQWHTMSRTSLSANLGSHRAEPYCEIHPHDALKYGAKDGELVEVKSQWGVVYYVPQSVIISVVDRFFAPIHWNDQVASDARIGKVVNPVVDAISGEPEFKHTPVMIHPFYNQWQGVFYVRQGFEKIVQSSIQNTVWWTKITTAKAVRYELADRKKFTQTTRAVKRAAAVSG